MRTCMLLLALLLLLLLSACAATAPDPTASPPPANRTHAPTGTATPASPTAELQPNPYPYPGAHKQPTLIVTTPGSPPPTETFPPSATPAPTATPTATPFVPAVTETPPPDPLPVENIPPQVAFVQVPQALRLEPLTNPVGPDGQFISGWDNGFRPDYYCAAGPFQWLDEDHLLLYPLTATIPESMGAISGLPLALDLADGSRWLPYERLQAEDRISECADAPVVSRSAGRLVSPADPGGDSNSVLVYDFSGQVVAQLERADQAELSVSPSGRWLYTGLGFFELGAGAAPDPAASLLEATAWSPDERQVYRCCHQYASTSSSSTSFSIGTIYTLGRGVPSGSDWIQSGWLWDNRQVLVDYDFRYADSEKSALPLFDPAAQTWLDLQATLGLPEENICRWWALSPDRRTVAIDCYDSGWYLADLQSNRVLELDMPPGGSAEFSPDGRLLALHSWDGAELRVFEADSGELLHTQAGARPLSWHPERPWLLVAAAGERSVAVLDLSDRQAPSLIAVPAPALHLHNLQPLALWAPQGGLLLVTELGELAWLPDIGGREPLVFTPPHDYVHAVKFSPDGRQVAFVAGRMDFGSREAIYVYPLPEE